MSSRFARLLALAAIASGTATVGCADFERGDPTPTVDAGAPADAGEAGAEAGAALSYARDIHPLLLDRCRTCHSDGGQAGHTTFVLTGAATADYGRTRAFIKESDGAGSRLVTKAAGTGHGGGSIYAVGSAGYQRLVQWIQEGALP